MCSRCRLAVGLGEICGEWRAQRRLSAVEQSMCSYREQSTVESRVASSLLSQDISALSLRLSCHVPLVSLSQLEQSRPSAASAPRQKALR